MKNVRVLVVLGLFLLMSIACNLLTSSIPTLDGVQAAQTENAQTSQGQVIRGMVTYTPIVQALRATPTSTLQPTLTLSPTERVFPTVGSTTTKTTVPCDLVTFVEDVNFPDGSEIPVNTVFTKTWRLQNIGSCTWTTDYAVVFFTGDSMDSPRAVPLVENVAPGQFANISVNMVAPAVPGDYTGYWKLRNAEGILLNLVEGGPFFLKIKVIPAVNLILVYDLEQNFCSATWTSSANTTLPLSCPGETDDDNGFVVEVQNPRLETGSIMSVDALETHPVWYGNPSWNTTQNGGWIQGIYPVMTIPSGARFRSQVGCLFKDGGTNCAVTFYLKYSTDGSTWHTLGTWHEEYDGNVQTLDVDLSFLADKTVQFMLMVDANNNAGADEALWVYPRIEK
jgi:hypothetical protein